MGQLKTVCVVGLGYIGLPTASLLATKGYTVLGVDVRQEVVDTINAGNIHIVEPGLDILVKSAVHSQNLCASLEPAPADVFILAVPTPFKDDLQPDLSYVEAASKAIAPLLAPGNLVILESTSPVGTTQAVKAFVEKANPAARGVHYAHCPERVIPGRVLQELVANDRVVGGLDAASTEQTVNFYRSFVQGEVIATDARTAELCKLAENAFRDVNIAFANELSLICDEADINVWELIRLANRHPRVNILQPGPGVGGHCIAVDPWFIVASHPKKARLIRMAREVNDSKPDWVIHKVEQEARKFQNPVIACLGLSFKANVDDLRESPALSITRKLAALGLGRVIACEPHVSAIEGLELCDAAQAVSQAAIVLVLVDHDVFKALDPASFQGKCIIDTRGVLAS
ncbi:MAG: UDP-N-acetyl-D-mannosamine dehydrogenase [Gammaproteobacteria bacterium CG11_big_fil_rev_8_21_14_0_20_46_22]|nr:MAG: UDP-N-acetyl-D-mannosamine dehydrogenase [Gammaproteobacteria bacterium CG12_big_fil_rev_8_21_14_0_65_46_12]PIR12139.1 MAG: UDP-N-acetyl-D-mannosamine dehydrogenase [Gammaproteobacteria bacterium CG11_big_fil_rev_8_21_14_0_20_46_22]